MSETNRFKRRVRNSGCNEMQKATISFQIKTASISREFKGALVLQDGKEVGDKECEIKDEPLSDSETNDWSVSKYLDQMEADFDHCQRIDHENELASFSKESRLTEVSDSLECHMKESVLGHSYESMPLSFDSSVVKEEEMSCLAPIDYSMSRAYTNAEQANTGAFVLPNEVKEENEEDIQVKQELTSGSEFDELSLTVEPYNKQTEINPEDEMETVTQQPPCCQQDEVPVTTEQSDTKDKVENEECIDYSLPRLRKPRSDTVTPEQVDSEHSTEKRGMKSDCSVKGKLLDLQSKEKKTKNGIKHPVKPSVCTVCTKSFNRVSYLKRHMKIHTGEKPHLCSFCAKSFKESASLTVHMRTHTGERPYKCLTCSKAFADSGTLTKHMRTHTGERPFPCSRCPKSFAESGSLTKHMRSHTGVKPYSCSICGRSFSDSSTLTKHMRTHTGDKLYNCSHCAESFTLPGQLAIHLKSHSEQRPYSCSVCDRSFTESMYLSMHMRTHAADRSHNCSTCNKLFTRSHELKKHMRIHTGEKPYSCPVCSMAFTQSSHRTNHMRTHTGEKLYSCSLCDKSFAVAGTLTTHLRTHTGDKPYQCSVCAKSFAVSSTLSRHLRTHSSKHSTDILVPSQSQ